MHVTYMYYVIYFVKFVPRFSKLDAANDWDCKRINVSNNDRNFSIY